MCSRQKAVPLGKISDFSRFFGDFYENERFSREEIRPTLCSTSAFKTVYAYVYAYVYLEFCNSGNSRIRILEFWNSGILELPKWTILKAEVENGVGLQNGPFPELQNSTYTYTYAYSYAYSYWYTYAYTYAYTFCNEIQTAHF